MTENNTIVLFNLKFIIFTLRFYVLYLIYCNRFFIASYLFVVEVEQLIPL